MPFADSILYLTEVDVQITLDISEAIFLLKREAAMAASGHRLLVGVSTT
jgi:hypothetical protein